ncbi:MAG: insulinase family protein, partial [Planctomycetaceae bacterium]|nr:insulinase family protein [Planctomycetaceae bacterium]
MLQNANERRKKEKGSDRRENRKLLISLLSPFIVYLLPCTACFLLFIFMTAINENDALSFQGSEQLRSDQQLDESRQPVQIGPDVPEITDRTEYPGGVTVAKLTNGLTVIVQTASFGRSTGTHSSEVVTVRCFVKNTGSSYETQWLGSGVSHLLEHIVAGGSTTKRSEKEIEKLVDKMGGATNAFTSNDATCYYIDTIASHLPLAIELVAESVQYAAFEPSEFDREHKVVMQELLDGEANRGRVLWKMLSETVYLEHPMRHPIIGYSDVLAKLTVEDAKA